MEEDAPHYTRGTEKGIMNGYYVNKDGYTGARKFVYNPRYHRTMDVFLRDLALKLKPPFGPIRRLVTPHGRHRVMGLSDLKPEQNYVVIGNGKFEDHNYETITPKRYRYQGNHMSNGYFGGSSDFGHNEMQYLQSYNTRNPKYRDVSSRIKHTDTQSIFFNVYLNGDSSGRYALVCLKPSDLKDFSSSCNEIANKTTDRFETKFHRIVRAADGSRVHDVNDFQHKEKYVVIPKKGEHFIPLNYGASLEPFLSSPRADYHSEKNNKKHPFVGYQRNNRPRTLPSIVGGPNSSRVGGGQNYSSPDYSVASNPEDGRNAKRPHNGYPLNKPQRHKPSPERQRKTQKSQQVDYDRNDGVFRAKGSNRETQGAKEVKDSSHTRTDLPIDQRKAEIVSDEEYDDDKRKKQSKNNYNEKNTSNKNIKNDNKNNRNDKNEDKKNVSKTEKSNDRNNKENIKRENEKDKKENSKEKDKNVKNNEKNNDKDKNKNVKGNSNNEKGKTTQKDHQKIDSSRKTASPYGNQQQKNTNNSNVRTSTPDSQNDREREEAAVKIQSQYKAFKQREKMAKEKEDETARKKQEDNNAKQREEEKKKQEADAKKKDEEAQKEAYNRRIEQELEEMRQKEEEEEKKRKGQQKSSEKKELSKEEAAAIIQSNYKAFKVREQVREKKKVNNSNKKNSTGNHGNMDEDEAATKIQAQYKGFKARKEVKQKKEEEKAATKIQAQYRGHKVRKDMKDTKTGKDKKDDGFTEEENNAAVKIQAGYRGHRTRKEVSKQKKDEEMAATKIQSQFRGHMTRKELAKQKDVKSKSDENNLDIGNTEEENKAAVKIQANYRGHKVRKDLNQKKRS